MNEMTQPDEPWWFEAELASSRLRKLYTILNLYDLIVDILICIYICVHIVQKCIVLLNV